MNAAMTSEKAALGTQVEVTYTPSGGGPPVTICVGVDDRGPFERDSKGRPLRPLRPDPNGLIDLTPAAFRALTGGISAGCHRASYRAIKGIRMMIFRKIAIYFIALNALILGNASAAQYRIYYRNLNVLPNERVIGIVLEIENGFIQSVTNLTRGWNINIDNKANNKAGFSGTIYVGAAALSLENIMGAVNVGSISNYGAINITGEIVVTSDFSNERHIKIDKYNVTLRESP